MIIYNIRANGPFEYDKFILNIGQIYNEYIDTVKCFKDSDIEEQVDEMTEIIKDYTEDDNMLNRLALITKAALS